MADAVGILPIDPRERAAFARFQQLDEELDLATAEEIAFAIPFGGDAAEDSGGESELKPMPLNVYKRLRGMVSWGGDALRDSEDIG